ncbi:hypothetical protein RM553_10010 [Zunongwangia sp. F363]|uniref:Uncharacterized protein n=1 Tax=Autumnicola tepida TaxID=3075595 RepID=A0ABU3C9Z2_9FLAO|nr:hypothetical protein [Zunongwangia sp. F363]MDT0643162.1 hypothetical protein [Zunongwangia sp. F363]
MKKKGGEQILQNEDHFTNEENLELTKQSSFLEVRLKRRKQKAPSLIFKGRWHSVGMTEG